MKNWVHEIRLQQTFYWADKIVKVHMQIEGTALWRRNDVETHLGS